MYKSILTLLSIACLWSCASATPGPPPVDMEELAPLVAEMQLAEALTNEIPVLVRDSMREVLFENILADHNTNLAAFDSVMWEIRHEPIWMEELYVKVGDILAKKSTE